jgi:hypothetical protein
MYKRWEFPQRSILSVALLSIKINSLAKALNDNIEGSLYVDDFLICYRGKNMNIIERQLQICLNKIENGLWRMDLNSQAQKLLQRRTPSRPGVTII